LRFMPPLRVSTAQCLLFGKPTSATSLKHIKQFKTLVYSSNKKKRFWLSFRI
jgi:hypothetical protein